MILSPASAAHIPSGTRELCGAAPEADHFLDPFFKRALARPEDLFCRFIAGLRGPGVEISQGEMLRMAAGVAQRLHQASCAAGEIVTIALPHSPWLYAAFMGASLAGTVPTFLPPQTRKQDPVAHGVAMEALLARIRPAALIGSVATMEAPGWDGLRILVEEIEPCDPEAPPRGTPEGLAFLQHSSGTTGLKKGVMLRHRQVADHIRRYAATLGLGPGASVVSWLPLYHDMGLVTGFLMPATLGVPIVSLDALQWVARPTVLLEELERASTPYAWLPNFAFHHLMRLDRGRRRWDLGHVRAVIDCSEPCRAATLDAFAARYGDEGLTRGKLGVSYAMAEAVFAVTQTALATSASSSTPGGAPGQIKGFASCGQPIPGAAFEVRRPEGGCAEEGEQGEVWISSSSLFTGYFRELGRADARMSNGWFRTGDLGLVVGGELFVVGREEDRLIVNGRNFLAHEIEDVVSNVPGIAPGRVLAHAPFDAELGTGRLIVLAEPAEPSGAADALAACVREAVETAIGTAPSLAVIVDRGFLQKSSSGKLAREASWIKWRDREGAHAAD